MSGAAIGVLGLGVMGRNLALNLADRGMAVAGYERDPALREAAAAEAGFPCHGDLAAFVAGLDRPRAVLLMITAGPAVDGVLDTLLPLLEPGDVVVDGGNSDWQDTARRGQRVGAAGLGWVGLGVSGGEEGARHGPSLMGGAAEPAWTRIEGALAAIAARAPDGSGCAARVGEAAASGHFVKMLHNGIEYADMQLIAEAYDLMSRGGGRPAGDCAAVFARWNDGPLQSFLIEVTALVLRKSDPETGRPLVDLILDSAGQKGTGRWAAIASLDLGATAPTIAEAVFARSLSAAVTERAAAAALLPAPSSRPPVDVDVLEQALLAAKLCAYAQGFQVLAAASREHGWKLPLATIARIWRAGCIIRAGFLDDVALAFAGDPAPDNLLLAPAFATMLGRAVPALRQVVAAAALSGIPAPAFASALAYYDGLRSARLPANLIQAQRDAFGAHTFRRTDRPGVFHADWSPAPEAGG